MACWLVKSEPAEWSWEDHLAVGVEPWTGVRNHQAAANLRAMRRGERAFFYHSGPAAAIVGILEVVREHYPDPTDPEARFVAVDLRALEPLARPVRLAAIKAEPRLRHLALVRQPRLSVVPVDVAAFELLLCLGNPAP